MRVSLLIIILSIVSAPIFAQGTFPNQRDDSYPLLGLKRAWGAFERAKNDLERNEQLMKKGLISQATYDQSKSTYLDAEVNYQQSLLVVLFEKQFVSVKQAVKYQDERGKKWVKIVLENTTGFNAEYQQIIQKNDSLLSIIRPDLIHNIYVSLSNDDAAIISKPYEQKLSVLKAGEPAELQFEVLQDVDALTVNIVYGNGTTRNPKVYLEKDASVNKVLFQSPQFSQEVELNGNTNYSLDLELFSGSENTFKLDVINLPKSINKFFVERGTERRISQIRFNQSSNTRNTDLRVFLPDRLNDTIQMDSAIPFFAVAIPADRMQEFKNLNSKIWTEEELIEAEIGYIKLELIPRGVGRLKVKVPQLFLTSQDLQTVTTLIKVENEGTRSLQNVEFELDLPFGWKYELEPTFIEELDIRTEKEVKLSITPMKNATVGRYEARLKTTSISDNSPVVADDKLITIQIPAQASSVGTGLLLLALVLLIGGLVYGGIKISKK